MTQLILQAGGPGMAKGLLNNRAQGFSFSSRHFFDFLRQFGRKRNRCFTVVPIITSLGMNKSCLYHGLGTQDPSDRSGVPKLRMSGVCASGGFLLEHWVHRIKHDELRTVTIGLNLR
jgi:hypothetical protein